MLKVGAIGWRRHAARMMRAVEESGLATISAVFHPDHVPDHAHGTSSFEDLLSCDAVMVLSPNATHCGYLQDLTQSYGGYVLCEKPPVTSKDELAAIEQLDWRRTFFNFNFRHSAWADILREAASGESIGQPVHVDISWTHGLAFKDSYASSWRADRAKHKAGILETVSIHAIDMLCGAFGGIEKFACFPSNVASTGTAEDTSVLTMRHTCGATSHILASYAAPYAMRLSATGTNGAIVAEGGTVRKMSPRDTFDSAGRFIEPAIVSEENWNASSMYQDSLRASVAYFLETCANKDKFPRTIFDQSLKSTRAFLDIGEQAF